MTTTLTRADAGNVVLDEDQRIVTFQEKYAQDSSRQHWISSGIYLINVPLFQSVITRREFMLETELFPSIMADHQCFGFIDSKSLIDIGTPERFAQASKYFGG